MVGSHAGPRRRLRPRSWVRKSWPRSMLPVGYKSAVPLAHSLPQSRAFIIPASSSCCPSTSRRSTRVMLPRLASAGFAGFRVQPTLGARAQDVGTATPFAHSAKKGTNADKLDIGSCAALGERGQGSDFPLEKEWASKKKKKGRNKHLDGILSGMHVGNRLGPWYYTHAPSTPTTPKALLIVFNVLYPCYELNTL